jgi:molecular chaperone Hsp33
MTSPTFLHAPDQLSRFLLPEAGVRGVAVHLDTAWQEMVARADNPPAVAELLGEAAAAAALFTGHAKVEGRLSVQLRSQGALRTLFAECTAAGTVRGIAQLDDALPPPGRDLAALGSDAMLAITIENPARGDREPIRYQGLVPLEAGSLSAAFEGYFRQSEQLPTRLLLACDGQRAAGLMVQKLPGDGGDDDGWNRVGALFDTLQAGELLDLPAAQVVHRLFHEEAPEWLAEKPLRFGCSCSRDRVSAMLVSLGRDEADAAVQAGAGEARIHCQFCGQEYRYDDAAIASLFADAAREMPAADRLQ